MDRQLGSDYSDASERETELTVERGKALASGVDGILRSTLLGGQDELVVKQRIINASLKFTDPAFTDATELLAVERELLECRDWMIQGGFVDHENDARWSLYLCYFRLKRFRDAAEQLLALRENIETARRTISNPHDRVKLTGRYPYLYACLARMMARIGDTEGLLAAIEGSKGRVLADVLCRRTGTPVAEDAFARGVGRLPEELPKVKAHYLTFLVEDG